MGNNRYVKVSIFERGRPVGVGICFVGDSDYCFETQIIAEAKRAAYADFISKTAISAYSAISIGTVEKIIDELARAYKIHIVVTNRLWPGPATYATLVDGELWTMRKYPEFESFEATGKLFPDRMETDMAGFLARRDSELTEQ
jgi:hypothetical protein